MNRLFHAILAFPKRYLLPVLFLLLFVLPAYSQSDPTNPTPDPTCGLPKEGTIVATVTYTLKANCTQTGWLEIKTSQTPSITLTINGAGHTIYNSSFVDSWKTTYLYNFLLVDDNGEETVQNVDNGRSPNVKVIIKNVTFDGSNLPFRRPHRLQSTDGKVRISGTGAGILVDGDLEMENVTFLNGNGIWVRAKGTASLKNVLFEDSWVENFSFRSTVMGMLHVAKSGSVTLNNAVFRDTARVVVAIEKGGQLTTTGCLSFIRAWTHKVHHSGVYSGFGTWSDSSTGACTGAIGNGGQAVVAYTPPTLSCGLPSGGTIGGTVVYTLTQPCVCVNTVNIAAGAHVTINGNGNRIEGCSSGTPQFRIGNANVTFNNVEIYGIRVRNYGGTFTLANSILAQTYLPLVNYGWTFLHDSQLVGNRGKGSGKGKVYYAHGYFNLGRALFRDNVFRGNTPVEDEIEAYTTGSSTAIYLCGENILDGDVPTELAQHLMAADGGGIFGCPGPPPPPTPVPVKVKCLPGQVEQPAKRHLGAIGVILYVEKCPLEIEIWEIQSNSQGLFALKVSQADIDAASEGLVACSANGRAAVRVGMTEPVRQIMAYSKTYLPPSQRGRGARDILISVGPTFEHKVHHLVIDHALDGTVLGAVDTRPDGPPCQGANASSLRSSAEPVERHPPAPPPPPQPTPIPIAAPVTAQPARADGSIVHVVQAGDTIWAIGVAYNVHPYKIIALNELEDPSSLVVRLIQPDEELLIRPAS